MASRSNKAARGIRPNVRFRALTGNNGGMIQNRAERFMPANAAMNIINMHSESEGAWTPHKCGYTNLNSQYESGAAFQGLTWYTEPDGTSHLVGAINAKLIDINTSDWTKTNVDTSTSFGTATQVDFEVFDGYLHSCDGSASAPRKLDGTTASANSGFPAAGTYTTPKYVEQHNNRLVFANFASNPSHIALSTVGAGETFPSSISNASDGIVLELSPGDGQQITGMKSIYLPRTNETALVVAKERSLYVITGQSALSSDADYFNAIRVNSTYGCVSNKSMVQVGNDLFMLGELPGGGFGIISYTTAMETGTLQPVFIGSDFIREELRLMNRAAVSKVYAVHLPNRREIIWGIPSGSSSTVNRWIVYKYPQGPDETPKWSIRTKITHADGLVFEDGIYFGTTDGYLSKWFTTSTYNGVSYSWRYEFPYNDLGAEGQHKRITTAFAHFKSSVATTVNIKSKWLGGGGNNSKSVPVNLGSNIAEAVYNTAVYGTAKYSGLVEIKRPFKVFGDGERVKFTLSGNTGVTGGPEFLGLTLFATYGGPSHAHN